MNSPHHAAGVEAHPGLLHSILVLDIQRASKSTPSSTLVGSPSPSQGGPAGHRVLTDSSSGVNPREGISAGLSFPGQYFQQSGDVKFLISVTRFCTKVFQVLLIPLIQHRETVESVKQRGGDNGNSVSRLCVTTTINRASRSADSSSSRGIV